MIFSLLLFFSIKITMSLTTSEFVCRLFLLLLLLVVFIAAATTTAAAARKLECEGRLLPPKLAFVLCQLLSVTTGDATHVYSILGLFVHLLWEHDRGGLTTDARDRG